MIIQIEQLLCLFSILPKPQSAKRLFCLRFVSDSLEGSSALFLFFSSVVWHFYCVTHIHSLNLMLIGRNTETLNSNRCQGTKKNKQKSLFYDAIEAPVAPQFIELKRIINELLLFYNARAILHSIIIICLSKFLQTLQ
jgi:hypothetical protein